MQLSSSDYSVHNLFARASSSSSSNSTPDDRILTPRYMEVWLVTSYCLCLLVVLTNVSVLLVVYRNRSLHTTTYAFICNLAVCDLIYGVCFAHFASVAYFPQLGGNFTVCRLALAGFYGSIGCSTVGVTLIAMERFVAIRYAIEYRRLMSNLVVIGSIAAAYTAVIGPVTTVVFVSSRRPAAYPQTIGCVTQKILPNWALISASCHIALTQLVATGCYATVYVVARRQQRLAKRQLGHRRSRVATRNWQLTASIGLLICLFYFFWIPTWALQLYRLGVADTRLSITLGYFSSSFSTLNSIVNIFVYWLRTREFRMAVKRTLLGGAVDGQSGSGRGHSKQQPQQPHRCHSMGQLPSDTGGSVSTVMEYSSEYGLETRL